MKRFKSSGCRGWQLGVLMTVLWTTASCGGGGSASKDNVQPPAATDSFANPQVSCGAYTLTLSGKAPWQVSSPSDWVVMGSSSAEGAGASSVANSWAGLLKASAAQNGATVHNIAKGGHTTYQALSSQCVVSGSRTAFSAEHNIEKALSLQPDLVILSYPSNDAASGLPVLETASNLMLLRWQLAQKNVPVLLLSTQPRNIDKNKQAALLELDRLLKPVLGPCFVDIHSLLADANDNLADQYNSGDGVHLNDAGHQIIFRAVSDRLASRQCVDIL